MQLSEFLQNRLDRARGALYTLSTEGWQTILEDQINRLEIGALKSLKHLAIPQNMDPETHRLIIEHQMQAKYAEIFRNIHRTYTNQVEQDVALLMQIKYGWAEDVEVPEDGPRPDLTLWETLKEQVRRIKEDIQKHVNV